MGIHLHRGVEEWEDSVIGKRDAKLEKREKKTFGPSMGTDGGTGTSIGGGVRTQVVTEEETRNGPNQFEGTPTGAISIVKLAGSENSSGGGRTKAPTKACLSSEWPSGTSAYIRRRRE